LPSASWQSPATGRSPVQSWMGGQKREPAPGADPLPAWLRDAAATIGAMTGVDGLPGGQAIAGNSAAWLNSARLARAELYDWGQAPEPSPEERGWLGAEAAAAALPARGEAWPEGCGPDEALCRLWEAAGGGPLDIGALHAIVRAAGHRTQRRSPLRWPSSWSLAPR
jgi:hypothetical protein